MFTSKIKLSAIVALFVGLLFTTTAVKAQVQGESQAAAITGKVIDAETEQPVSGIELKIKGTQKTVETGQKGKFSFNELRPGKYAITANPEGYKEVVKQVELASSEKEVTIKLKPGCSGSGSK